MLRTQIQLTEDQADRLRCLAAERGVSVAALVRQAVDGLLAEAPALSKEERRSRIMSVGGRYSSGCSDVSEKHDEHLAEIVRDR